MASKISAGAKGKALEGYFELLSLVVRDEKIDPEERHALSRYRARHAVPDTEHWRMLDELGWTIEEYDHGFLQSKYRRSSSSMSTLQRWFGW